VNRISVGVQSMAPHVLRGLDRTHEPDNVVRAVAAARAAGIEQVNVDLIYGTPGESLDDWHATLTGALALEPDHVSAYALTVEPGTPFGKDVAAGARAAPDDDDQADKYVLADTVLEGAGLRWYEISNWARPGAECRHNALYWHGGDYVAIGCAAHGARAGRRWWNVRTPERYVAAIESGASPEAGAERLDAAGRAEEAFGLALRTRAGAVPPPGAQGEVDHLVGAGLLTRGGAGVVLTRQGRLLASEVTTRLAVSAAR
jgi:oxygen-independent coproporphyrinogen-3 oxidase